MGDRFAQSFDYNRLLCVPIGAFLVGLIGFQTFRVWVGVAIAALLSMVVLSGFGANRIVPHLSDYNKSAPWVVPDATPGAEPEYMIPTRDEQSAYLDRTPRVWASDFWKFLTERDPSVAKNTQALAILTALGGLCIGLMAVRPSLIISTSLIGTILVTTGVATLLTHSVPASYEALQGNPRLIGIGVAAFLATSLVLQTMLMRKSSIGEPKPAQS